MNNTKPIVIFLSLITAFLFGAAVMSIRNIQDEVEKDKLRKENISLKKEVQKLREGVVIETK